MEIRLFYRSDVLYIAFLILACILQPASADYNDLEQPPRQMENLGRGIVAVNLGGGRGSDIYIGWRLLGTDPNDIAFNLYRSTDEAEPVKLNDLPMTQSTNYIDRGVNLGQPNSYFVKPVIEG